MPHGKSDTFYKGLLKGEAAQPFLALPNIDHVEPINEPEMLAVADVDHAGSGGGEDSSVASAPPSPARTHPASPRPGSAPPTPQPTEPLPEFLGPEMDTHRVPDEVMRCGSWGCFKITPKQATAKPEFGGFQVACPFHRLKSKMVCKRLLSIAGPTKKDKLECVQKLMMLDGVGVAVVDMCACDMRVDTGPSQGPARKTTEIMSNSKEVLKRAISCPKLGDDQELHHVHVPLESGQDRRCQVYPRAFSQSICEGIASEKKLRRLGMVSVPIMSLESDKADGKAA